MTSSVQHTVVSLLSQILETPYEEFEGVDALGGEFELDSLDRVEFVVALEARVGAQLLPEDSSAFESVTSLVEVVTRRLRERDEHRH